MTETLARLRQLEAAATPGPWPFGDHRPPLANLDLVIAARNALPQLLDGMDILVQMVKTRDEYDEAFQTRDWQTCERIEYESEHDDLHQRAKSLLAALDSQETE